MLFLLQIVEEELEDFEEEFEIKEIVNMNSLY
jgi:hypothetical protein